MNGDERDPKRTWLNQHDSLQEELQMLKEEMRADRKGEIKAAPDPIEPEVVPPSNIREVVAPAGDEPEGDPPTVELTIKDMLGAVEPQTPPDQDNGPRQKNPGGAIPKHPELTSYIAKVMQHESRIKRKKFERDKVHKPREETTARNSETPVSNSPPSSGDLIIDEPQEAEQSNVRNDPVQEPEQEQRSPSEGSALQEPLEDTLPINESPEPRPEVFEGPKEDPPVRKAKYMTDVRDDKANERPSGGRGFLVRIRRKILGR